MKAEKKRADKLKTNKYGVSPAWSRTVDGITFDSKLECDRYSILKLMERSGHISDLKLQVEYELQPGFTYQGKKERPILYVADFQYVNTAGLVVVEDAKGVSTKDFLLKRKMLLYRYPDIHFVLVRTANENGGLYLGGTDGKATVRRRPASSVSQKGP